MGNERRRERGKETSEWCFPEFEASDAGGAQLSSVKFSSITASLSKKCKWYDQPFSPLLPPQPIPFCPIGGVSSDYSDMKEDDSKAGKGPEPRRTGHWLPLDPPSRSGEAIQRESVNDDDDPEEYPNPHPNPSAAGSRKYKQPCKTEIGPGGMRITTLTGWKDWKPPPPIVMMSRKMDSVTLNRHPRYTIHPNEIYSVRLDFVESPTQFYMEVILKAPPDDCGTWEECMQQFYTTPGNAQKYKLRTLRPLATQLYAVYTMDLSMWERIRVHSISPTRGTVAGMYIDRLKPFNDLSVDLLYELHPHFGNWPKYPLMGSLAHVKPVRNEPESDEDPEEKPRWSEEAKQFFKDYTKGKVFRAFIVNRSLVRKDNIPHSDDEDRFTSASVILLPTGGDEPEIPVNALLVLKGYGMPVKSMKHCEMLCETLLGVTSLEAAMIGVKRGEEEED